MFEFEDYRERTWCSADDKSVLSGGCEKASPQGKLRERGA